MSLPRYQFSMLTRVGNPCNAYSWIFRYSGVILSYCGVAACFRRDHMYFTVEMMEIVHSSNRSGWHRGPGALHLDTRLKPQESMRKLMDVGCCRMFFGFQHWDSSCIGCPQTHLFIKTVCRRCPSSSLVATSLALSGTSGICTAINSTVGNASWNGASKCGAPHTKLTRTPQMWWQMLVISRWIQVFWKMSHKISPWIHGTSTIWGSYRNMMEYVDILYDFF